jgi:hypothetical protein
MIRTEPFEAAVGSAMAMIVHPRLRIRFSLRIMFALLTAFAALFGWQANIVWTRAIMRREIENSGATFGNVQGGGIQTIQIGDPNYEFPGDTNYKLPLLRRLLGDSPVFGIFFPRIATSDDIRRSSYFPEASVWAFSPSEEDAGAIQTNASTKGRAESR